MSFRAQTAADSLGKQLEQHTRASEALFGNIRALESKVSEALSKKETLKARAASAQVRFPLYKNVTQAAKSLQSYLHADLSSRYKDLAGMRASTGLCCTCASCPGSLRFKALQGALA